MAVQTACNSVVGCTENVALGQNFCPHVWRLHPSFSFVFTITKYLQERKLVCCKKKIYDEKLYIKLLY